MYTIIQSILVYGIMALLMTYNANRVLKKRFVPLTFKQFITDSNILFPLILFSLITAIRWDVGADCRSYIYNFYDEISERNAAKGEVLFHWVSDFFKIIGLTHVPFFFTLGFIQLAMIYYGLRKSPHVLLFFPLMFLIYGTFWIYMNGVRQCIACSAFMFVTLLMTEKKWIWAAFWIFVATLFHRSAYILFIFAPILYLLRNNILNKNIQLVILITCYAMMGMSVGEHFELLSQKLLSFIGYEKGSQEHLLKTVFDINFGFRAYLMLLSNIIVVLFSTKIKDFFNSTHFNIIYNAYFIGLCSWLLFYGNHGMERISMYFTCFTPIILSCAAYYFYINNKKNIYALSLIVIISLLILRTVYDLYSASTSVPDFVNYRTLFFNY